MKKRSTVFSLLVEVVQHIVVHQKSCGTARGIFVCPQNGMNNKDINVLGLKPQMKNHFVLKHQTDEKEQCQLFFILGLYNLLGQCLCLLN